MLGDYRPLHTQGVTPLAGPIVPETLELLRTNGGTQGVGSFRPGQRASRFGRFKIVDRHERDLPQPPASEA
ncbi:MAG: hypothetical protein G01um1014106_689 [Parcubacteria group bacterium Gr01-1014_106]|nr:MAG: hypothetical protein G01um1014106_689 [Parcubacteria group bacterium Gr01-1014_106]